MEEKEKLLELEKRIIDVELSLEKIKEKLKGIDEAKLKDMVERFEDVEDLVMVENAGVVELKKMLESSLPAKIDERINSAKSELEKKIKEKLVVEAPKPVLEEIKSIKNQALINKSNLDVLAKNVERISERLASLQPTEKIFQILDEVKRKNTEIENKLKQVNELYAGVSSLANKLQTIDPYLKRIDEAQKLIEKIRVEVEKNKKDVLSAASVEEIEKINKRIEALNNEIAALKGKMLPSPSFEDFMNRTMYLETKLNKLEKLLSTATKAPIIIE